MQEHLIGAAILLGLQLLPTLWAFFLPRDKTVSFGEKCGKFISTFLRQKKLEGAVEDRFASTLQDFTQGVLKGLKEDNA